MNAAAHTAAPWFLVGEDEIDGMPVYEVGAGEIGTPSFVSIAYIQPSGDGGDESSLELTAEDLANANLVVAGPALLAVARKCEAMLTRQKWRADGDDPEAVLLREARAAIALTVPA